MKWTRPIFLTSSLIRSLLFWFALMIFTGIFSGILSGTFSAQELQDRDFQTKLFRLEGDTLTRILNTAPIE
ncbi:MAG: hypothetical protein M3X11_25940, partial [Acidobacteriota bacterium]|nr:hypothetical protein [Acidobacteriota bacterium]